MFNRAVAALNSLIRVALLFSLLLASACGGGGNDFPESDGGSGNPAPPPDSATTPAPPPADTAPANTASNANSNNNNHDEEDDDDEDDDDDDRHSHRPGHRPRTLASAAAVTTAPPPDAQIQMSAQGTGIALWRAHDGTRYNLWASHFDGANWGAARLLENEAGDISAAHVAMDLNGNALAVWDQLNATSGSDIWAAFYRIENGWNAAHIVSEPGAGTSRAFGARVGFASDGSATATWQQIETNGFSQGWFNVFSPQAGWAGATITGDATTGG